MVKRLDVLNEPADLPVWTLQTALDGERRALGDAEEAVTAAKREVIARQADRDVVRQRKDALELAIEDLQGPRVPIEPTAEMLAVGAAAGERDAPSRIEQVRRVWTAMVGVARRG